MSPRAQGDERSAALAEAVLAGDERAAARLMRLVDDDVPLGTEALARLFRHTGRARVIGVTGPPGAGKSTLTDRLVAAYRRRGKTVGVLAVDPTSPFSGGAILGDRIRMQGHANDPGVFIRSLATRGSLGGLSRATGDCVHVLDALGRDVIIVETVGVGQDEIDVARLAHTTVLVLVPGMGDDIQAIKAGILEVADVFAVNKADLEGADRVVRELRAMLELRRAVQGGAASAWEPPIEKVVAARDEGVDALVERLAAHFDALERSGERRRREQLRAKTQFVALLRERLLRAGLARLERESGHLDGVIDRIAAREADPYALADEIAAGAEGRRGE